MSEIIWHQLPKDLIKVICKFAEDEKPSALAFFQANSNKLDWGSLSRNPMRISDTPTVWHWQTRPNVNSIASVDISSVNWNLLSNNIRQEERQIETIKTKDDALLIRLALLMRVRF